MEIPNKQLYEELIEKSIFTIVDNSKTPYIFTGKKYLQVNFNNMSVREAINYLTCLYSIIGTVDADHQAEFEADPIVDHIFYLAYKIYKNGKNDIEKWSEISAAQKNIARVCIDPFLEKLGMQKNDPNSVEFSDKIIRSERNLKAALDNNDIKQFDPVEFPELVKKILADNERYNYLYPNPNRS